MNSWGGQANEGWVKNIDEQMDREMETDRLITFLCGLFGQAKHFLVVLGLICQVYILFKSEWLGFCVCTIVFIPCLFSSIWSILPSLSALEGGLDCWWSHVSWFRCWFHRYVTQWKIHGAEHFLFVYFSTYMLCYNNFKILESQSCNREDKTSTGKAKVLLEKSISQRQYWTSKSRLYICSFSWYK